MKRGFVRKLAPLAALPFALGACGEQPAATAVGETTARDLYSLGDIVDVHPGESVLTNVISSNEASDVIDDIAITDHQYPNGWEDSRSPIIGTQPIRVDAHTALTDGDDSELSNDIACDTLRVNLEGIDESRAYLGAISISEDTDNGDIVQVNWPLGEDSGPSDYAYICFAEGHEPQNGVVLFISDQGR